MPQTPASLRYRLILDLARKVTGERELPAVLDATFAGLRELLEFGGAAVALVDDEDRISFAATDPPGAAMSAGVDEGVAGRMVRAGEPVYVPDGASPGAASYLGVPLIAEGRAIGLLQIDSPAPDAWSEDDRMLLLSFTPIVAAAVQNARQHAREQAAIDRLRELDERHRDFVAMVSHELRTPLTAVMGYGETIASHHETLGPDGVLRLVERSRGAAARLAGLVEELLDLSVIQRGALRLAPEDVDVPALVAEAVEHSVPDARTVTVDVAPDLPPVVTDRARLAQVVGNLLSNAAKFSPEDAPVEVRVTRDAEAVSIAVTDHGTGVPHAERDRIFERFVQLDGVRTRRGFGLGLYVARQVAGALGATVTVEGEPGQGSTFTVRVPLK